MPKVLIVEDDPAMAVALSDGFRYEGYRDPFTPDVKSAGLDVGLNSDMQLGDSRLVTRITSIQ